MIKKLISGALFNILNIIVQVLLGLIVFREMLLHFGEADFGLWSLLFAILAHIQLFEFGLGSMMSKLVPALKKPKDSVSKALFSTAFFTLNSIFVTFFVILIIASIYVDTMAFDFESGASFGFVVFLLGCNFLFIFQTGALHAYLTGNFKVGRINSVRLFINTFRAILIISLLQFEYSVFVIALVFASVAFLELTLLLTLALKVGLKNDLDRSLCSSSSLKIVIDRGSRLFFLSLNNYTRKNAAIIVGGLSLGVVAIVPMRIAGRLMEIYVEISTALNYLLTPYFSSFEPDDDKTLQQSFLVSISCATALSVLIFSNIILLGDWFLTIWLGVVPEFTSEILQITAIGFCIANMQGPCTSMLISKDRNNVLMTICISEISILLLVILPAIQMFGILGAAYALSAGLVVSRALVQPILICKSFGISYKKYLTTILYPAIATYGTLNILYFVATSFVSNNQIISTVMYLIFQTGLILLGAIYFLKRKRV